MNSDVGHKEYLVTFNPDKIDDAVLALLQLGLHDGNRTWKSFNWDVMDRLYEKGFISNPAGKAKSVVLTELGMAESDRLFAQLFGSGNEKNSSGLTPTQAFVGHEAHRETSLDFCI